MTYDADAVAAAKEHVNGIRSRTVCAVCGGQPIEWHHDDHVLKPNRRVSNLTCHGFPLDVIDAEISKCEPLCRRCHMKADGRADNSGEKHPRAKLTADQVEAIRADTRTQQEIADCYGISRPHVGRIKRYARWKGPGQ